MGKEIIEPGEKTLRPCDSNDIPKLEYIRALPMLTRSESRGMTKPVHVMTVIKHDSSARKGDGQP